MQHVEMEVQPRRLGTVPAVELIGRPRGVDEPAVEDAIVHQDLGDGLEA